MIRLQKLFNVSVYDPFYTFDLSTPSYSNPPTSHLAGLSIAYETLSDTSAKLIYDISGPSNRPSFADAATVDGNETLQALLKQVSKMLEKAGCGWRYSPL